MQGEDQRAYLREAVGPAVAEGLEKLTHELVRERKRVLEGVDWENGYLPDDWKSVETVKWLGEYLIHRSQKTKAEANMPTWLKLWLDYDSIGRE